MFDETEEALEDRIRQIQRRAENFRELLKEGEEVTIAYFDGEMSVEESYRSLLERKHPKLFGRLLSIEAQLATGWVCYFLGVLVVIFVLFGLELAWWEPVLGADVCDLLNRWWFYLALPASVVYLVSLGYGQWQKRVYRRHRHELLQLLDRAQLDRDVLLVMLRDINELGQVFQELKLDAGPFPTPG